MAMGRRGQGAAAGGGGAQYAYPVLAAAPRRMRVTVFAVRGRATAHCCRASPSLQYMSCAHRAEPRRAWSTVCAHGGMRRGVVQDATAARRAPLSLPSAQPRHRPPSEMPSRGCGEALQIRGARYCRCAARRGRKRTRPGKQRHVVEQRYMATGGRPGRRR
eukprot:Tamp_19985.p2 GENE.Tamp_19985~~Tamp_19985.p2  ORF type:complete len:161 (+),score=1.38 Tamp_19985:63-545(+)